ncbi:arsenic resistance protein [Paenibacillus pasadenensis]|uniref:arsenic resistance protein n=1 Tax=Paenibacillus pasadenensis TaxID=217090 RepID=UPI002041089D|nr:arsenic resistance protein [Paenibacillus pasadenensis]MCM3748467.1 arsenic resistance protein [Paenibacillus pasadenensis]
MSAAREKLERHQVPIYAAMLLAGAVAGLLQPGAGSLLEGSISALLAVLLYSMFSQIPFLHLRAIWDNKRFAAALLLVNFAAVPLLVWLLAGFLPDHPPLLLAVYLVLLAPCIDYVIVFTGLGKGDEKLMLAATPLLFAAQLVLLPCYLWLMLGSEAAGIIEAGPFVESFVVLIAVPLLLAVLTQLSGRRWEIGKRALEGAAWLPVPLMALALFAIMASQIGKAADQFSVIAPVIPVYIAFMALSPVLAGLAGRVFRLDAGAGRALAFSAGTRNSLVVLPLAFSLPEEAAVIAAAAIVTQTIVELAGELVYVRALPRLIRDRSRLRS